MRTATILNRMTERRILLIVLVLTVVNGLSFAWHTPVFEAGDELWHYPMVQHLGNGNPLPVQVFDAADAGPWKQQASQPPLYYYLGAALTFWIDTSDMSDIRWQNPHVDSGIVTSDGNINLTIHNPNWSPFSGTLLAVRIVRLLSVLLLVGTAYFTYLLAKTAVPNRSDIALGATAMVAFLPMLNFVGGAVNNDNLIIFLATVALVTMTQIVESGKWKVESKDTPFSLSPFSFLFLGVIIGLACLTKISGVGLLALAWGTAFIASYRVARSREASLTVADIFRVLGKSLVYFGITLIPVAVIAGWWYWRNVQLYGDWRGWSAFFAVLGVRNQPATLAQLWDERFGFMQSYWGLFGGVNVPLADWIYSVLNWMLVGGVVGFGIFLLVESGKWKVESGNLQSPISVRSAKSPNLLISFFTQLCDLVVKHFTIVVCLLWVGAVVYGIIDWATTTWSSQGRLVFSALSAEMTLLTVGLVGWLPQKVGKWVMGTVGVFMFVITAVSPHTIIKPTYEPQSRDAEALLLPVESEFGDTLTLFGAAPSKDTVRPGESFDLLLDWELLTDTDRNWSIFVHLTDPVIGVPIAQRDMYLGQGLLATSFMDVGQTIRNQYRLTVPETAVSPTFLQLNIGVYDVTTGERLINNDGNDIFYMGDIQVVANDGDVPNATAVNFSDLLTLQGYTLEKRTANAGESLELTLFWQTDETLSADYTFFAQILDEDTTRWAAQDLPVPTTQWQAGETNEITLTLPLREDTPADVYPIRIGVYTQEDGNFVNLQTVIDDRLADNFWNLTHVRINE